MYNCGHSLMICLYPHLWSIMLENCCGYCKLGACALHCCPNYTIGCLCHSIIVLLWPSLKDLLVCASFVLKMSCEHLKFCLCVPIRALYKSMVSNLCSNCALG
uniref:Uncharacterized protein n=1 Tax=Opuntia streptacantha TaxID=393608 RepID=A0A7C9D7V3_OPUST